MTSPNGVDVSALRSVATDGVITVAQLRAADMSSSAIAAAAQAAPGGGCC
jgi:hypothetical protein